MEDIFDEDESPLEDLFNKAADHLRSLVDKLDKQDLLYFYAHFKQATNGRCNTKKPGMFDFQGKQKWDAWSKLGDMSQEEAMDNYVQHMDLSDGDWRDPKHSRGGGLGIGVSTLYREEGGISESDKTVFDWCKEGSVENVQRLLTSSTGEVDDVDDSGLALIHWACDRGYLEVIDLLARLEADLNLPDIDGQTPLHYAATCEHAQVVERLLEHGADISRKDHDGQLPADATGNSQIRDLLAGYNSDVS